MTHSNEPQTNPPVAKLRDGAISIAIFRNEGEKGPRFSGTPRRTYKDANDEYRDTTSFSGTEWLRLAELACTAYREERALKEAAWQDARTDEAVHEHHGRVAPEQA